jgi:hypothetical protein
MKTRFPDPFPWPDDEICVEFGRSSYYAHKLEREMKLFLEPVPIKWTGDWDKLMVVS